MPDSRRTLSVATPAFAAGHIPPSVFLSEDLKPQRAGLSQASSHVRPERRRTDPATGFASPWGLCQGLADPSPYQHQLNTSPSSTGKCCTATCLMGTLAPQGAACHVQLPTAASVLVSQKASHLAAARAPSGNRRESQACASHPKQLLQADSTVSQIRLCASSSASVTHTRNGLKRLIPSVADRRHRHLVAKPVNLILPLATGTTACRQECICHCRIDDCVAAAHIPPRRRCADPAAALRIMLSTTASDRPPDRQRSRRLGLWS
jgi:hypothetical protein